MQLSSRLGFNNFNLLVNMFSFKSLVVLIAICLTLGNSVPVEENDAMDMEDIPNISITETNEKSSNDLITDLETFELDIELLRERLGIKELSTKLDDVTFEMKLWRIMAIILMLSFGVLCILMHFCGRQKKTKTVPPTHVFLNYPRLLDGKSCIAGSERIKIPIGMEKPLELNINLLGEKEKK